MTNAIVFFRPNLFPAPAVHYLSYRLEFQSPFLTRDDLLQSDLLPTNFLLKSEIRIAESGQPAEMEK